MSKCRGNYLIPRTLGLRHPRVVVPKNLVRRSISYIFQNLVRQQNAYYQRIFAKYLTAPMAFCGSMVGGTISGDVTIMILHFIELDPNNNNHLSAFNVPYENKSINIAFLRRIFSNVYIYCGSSRRVMNVFRPKFINSPVIIYLSSSPEKNCGEEPPPPPQFFPSDI